LRTVVHRTSPGTSALTPRNLQWRHSWHCECIKAMRTPITSGSSTDPGVGSAQSPELNSAHHIEDAMEKRLRTPLISGHALHERSQPIPLNTPVRWHEIVGICGACGLSSVEELVAEMGAAVLCVIAHCEHAHRPRHRRLTSGAGFASYGRAAAPSYMPLRTHRWPSIQFLEPRLRRMAGQFRRDREQVSNSSRPHRLAA
jgi:hypothetical protein